MTATHRRAVDRAVAGDVDRIVVGDDAARDRGAVKIKHRTRVDLNNAGTADADTIERGAQGCLNFKEAERSDRQRPASDRRVVLDNQFAVKGQCGIVDSNGAKRVVDTHAIERRARCGFDFNGTGIGEYSSRDDRAELKRQHPGDGDQAVGVGDGLVIQRIVGVVDIDPTGIAQRAVLQHRRAGEIDDAVGVVGDGAAGDGGVVELQRRA